MANIPSTLLQLDKPGTPTLTIVKGDTAQFVFTYMVDSGDVTPTGLVNGVNAVFTLPAVPVAGSLLVKKNGVLQELGRDYSITGATITFIIPPYTGNILVSNYKSVIDLSTLTSTWDLRTSPTAAPLLSGSGSVAGSSGTITVTLTPAQTGTLSPLGTGNNSNTYVGVLTLKIADASNNTKTLEKAQINLVL